MPSRSSMLADTFFSDALNDYVTDMTVPESTLLNNLRLATQAETVMPMMLSGPVEGQLLRLLVSLSGAKSCLEIGTFTGYASLNIASALPPEGILHTLDINPNFTQIAQRFFDKSPHGHKIKIHLGAADKTLNQLDTTFDFAFIDADKQNYVTYYDLVVPMMKRGSLIIIDNALWGGNVVAPQDPATRAIHQMNVKAKSDPRVEPLMLTVRDGILILRVK